MGREIYVNIPLSSQKILKILETNPELEKIKCPPSLYKRIAPQYLDVLSKLGVEVEPLPKKGRPRKYGEKEVKSIQGMLQKGYTPQKISERLGIPLKTVYYLNKTPLERGRKRKYSLKTEKKVKNLYHKGLSAREISEDMNIPLRTVYFLLKR